MIDCGTGADTVIISGFAAGDVAGAVPNVTVTDPQTGGTYLILNVETVTLQ